MFTSTVFSILISVVVTFADPTGFPTCPEQPFCINRFDQNVGVWQAEIIGAMPKQPTNNVEDGGKRPD